MYSNKQYQSFEEYLMVQPLVQTSSTDERSQFNQCICTSSWTILQAPRIQEEKWIDVHCFYSSKLISTLLSNKYDLPLNEFSNQYRNQSMLKFFNPKEEILDRDKKR